MGFFTKYKARKALLLQSKGQAAEAERLYEKAIEEGLNSARYLLAYSVMLIKKFDFEKAKKIILLAEKAPDLSNDQKRQIYINYAICLFKSGESDKAIKLLEKEHRNRTSGLLQQTLGYFYVENGDFGKAYEFITEALDYDSEDAIVLDNMAQYYYRKPDPDKEKAKEYFEMALERRPKQIDTLYFLSLYDIENGDTEAAKAKIETALNGNFSPLNYAQKDTLTKLLHSLEK